MRELQLKQSLIRLSLLLSMALSNPLNAMQSGYLDAIKADYDEFNSGIFELPAESSWIGSEISDGSNGSLSYEKLHDFALFLKQASPGSFIFFNILPDKYKNQLHQQYLKTGNLDKIKQDIFIYSNELKPNSLK
ncbi:MAG: hypothetical protein P8163_07430 [Candidatus Thiodiazotropha sp.]